MNPEFRFKIIKYDNPETYYSFTFIDVKYIKIKKQYCLNFIICNIFFKCILYRK